METEIQKNIVKICVCQNGHRCQGTDANGEPACVICVGLPGYQIKTIDFDFTGRKAYCHCGKEVDSSPNLAFFEIGGCIKRAPEELLKIKRDAWDIQDKILRTKLTLEVADVIHGRLALASSLPILRQGKAAIKEHDKAMAACKNNAPDSFYCGCDGWD
jgi:hypothetical protein